MSVVEILAHLFDFAHEFTRALVGFGFEVDRGAEDERAEILGAGFVVLPAFVTLFIKFRIDVAGAATGASLRVVPNWYTEHLMFAVAVSFAAAVPEISTADAGSFRKSSFD